MVSQQPRIADSNSSNTSFASTWFDDALFAKAVVVPDSPLFVGDLPSRLMTTIGFSVGFGEGARGVELGLSDIRGVKILE